MTIKPETVVKRYDRCIKQGNLPSLKFLLNFFMFKCFNGNRDLAKDYSEILSAIDDDRVQELDDKSLEVLGEVFVSKPR
jgi:hypothetical protein